MRLVVANIILVVVLFAGCKKEPKKHYITDQSLRDALNMKEGSYFIYRDSVTNELDTITIDKSENNFADQVDEYNGYYEYISVRGSSRLNNYFLLLIGASPNSMSMISGVIGQDYKSIIIAENLFTVCSSNNVVQYINYHDSFTVRNYTYNKVYEIINSLQDFTFHTYFSLESGLIKYSITNTNSVSSYELIDSKIIR